MNGSSWSLSLGCWSGVHVRLHVTLPLLIACALLVYIRAGFPVDRVVFIVLSGLMAVVIHAVTHVLWAARYGVETREIVLSPWGEASPIESPPTAEGALHTQVGGIMANAFVCAAAAIVLWLAGDTSISELLIPLDSRLLLQQDNHLILRWLFCLNYLLVLMNLLPAAPFDGGRILHALLRLTAAHLDDRTIGHSVVMVGRIVGLVLIVAGFTLGAGDVQGPLPAWFPLTVLGMIALFAGESPEPISKPQPPPPMAEDLLDANAPVDENPFDTAEELDWEDGPFAQWLQEKKEAEATRRLERQEAELADERRVDEILARLHERGSSALSAEDRRILMRVSDRLRRRREKKSL